MSNYLLSLLGGAVIGVAISLMLLFNGRVTGVSGIVSGALKRPSGDIAWRVSFIAGLIAGGLILLGLHAESITNTLSRDLNTIIIAGLLVGFGTAMGSGCTSGHGICGISRLSVRSILATVTFIGFGVISASAFRLIFGGS